jgi:hypothetical protein
LIVDAQFNTSSREVENLVRALKKGSEAFQEAQKNGKKEPFEAKFILDLRDSLDCLIKNEDLSKGDQSCALSILGLILEQLNAKGNELFHKTVTEYEYDVAEGQKDTMKKTHGYIQVGNGSVWKREVLSALSSVALVPVVLDESKGTLTFEQHLKDCFLSNHVIESYQPFLPRVCPRLKQVGKHCKFLMAPPYIFFEMNRGPDKKKENSIKLEENFSLDATLTKDGRGGVYQVRWMIVHVGVSLSSGHYIHYRLTDQGWHRFSDANVSQVSEKDIKKALQSCSLFFAMRIDQKQQDSAPI